MYESICDTTPLTCASRPAGICVTYVCMSWVMACIYMTHDAYIYVWHESVRGWWRGVTWRTTHTYIWHDSYIFETWLIHICDMTRDSYFCVTWVSSWMMVGCDVAHDAYICVTTLLHICDITHTYMWHDSWLIFLCDMSQFVDDGGVWLGSWRIHICDMTHDSYFCVTWLSLRMMAECDSAPTLSCGEVYIRGINAAVQVLCCVCGCGVGGYWVILIHMCHDWFICDTHTTARCKLFFFWYQDGSPGVMLCVWLLCVCCVCVVVLHVVVELDVAWLVHMWHDSFICDTHTTARCTFVVSTRQPRCVVVCVGVRCVVVVWVVVVFDVTWLVHMWRDCFICDTHTMARCTFVTSMQQPGVLLCGWLLCGCCVSGCCVCGCCVCACCVCSCRVT